MRIVVIGTSGAGKSTLAGRLAAEFGVPHVELDAINWQPGWRDLAGYDPPEFARRVAEAVEGDAWVVDGNYGAVRTLVWRRATHLVWLDYSRAVVMGRVIRRSLWRALQGTELWAGNREDWRRLLRPSHPIRWAWSTWRRRRREIMELLENEKYPGLLVLRLRRPREADGTVARLAQLAHESPAGLEARPAAR